MPINIDHSKSGNVVLQTSDVLSDSVFVFPNAGDSSPRKLLVSGLATIDDISGLKELVYSGADTFIKNNTSLYCCAISQNAPGEESNLATGDYSLALGYNSCAGYNYQISHGVEANQNLGWKQSSQYICALNTTSNQVCSVLNSYQNGSDYSNSITYIKGNALARGSGIYATFEFSATTVNDVTTRSLYSNQTLTGSSNISAGFYISSENNAILLNVSGSQDDQLNWLVCLNELKLKTN